RRHTRSDRDWSSDVCSSDLDLAVQSAVILPLSICSTATTLSLRRVASANLPPGVKATCETRDFSSPMRSVCSSFTWCRRSRAGRLALEMRHQRQIALAVDRHADRPVRQRHSLDEARRPRRDVDHLNEAVDDQLALVGSVDFVGCAEQRQLSSTLSATAKGGAATSCSATIWPRSFAGNLPVSITASVSPS